MKLESDDEQTPIFAAVDCTKLTQPYEEWFDQYLGDRGDRIMRREQFEMI